MASELDDLGRRRTLSAWETAWWYGFAGVTYVGAAIAEKGLLNWVIGPLWLVAVVMAGPVVVDRVRACRQEAGV